MKPSQALADIIAETRLLRYPSLAQPHMRHPGNPTTPTDHEQDYARHLIRELKAHGFIIAKKRDEDEKE